MARLLTEPSLGSGSGSGSDDSHGGGDGAGDLARFSRISPPYSLGRVRMGCPAMKRLITTIALVLLFPLAVVVGALAALTVAAPVAPVPVVAAVPDPLQAGERALAGGDPLLAIAYFGQVSRSDPWAFSHAQRMIGYRVYTNRLDRPAEGLRYVFRSVAADPLSGNTWQDAARTVTALLAADRP